jgi:hypothetical protein
LLRPKTEVSWRPTVGEDFPIDGTGETVVFLTHIECRFGVLAGDFFCGFLFFYWIELVHLILNSITITASFIHLCEAYLGIEPHFHLWCHFFELLKMGKSGIMGSVGFMLRRYMKPEYVDLVLSPTTPPAESKDGSTSTTLHRLFQVGWGELPSRTHSGPTSSRRERQKSCALCWTT